MAERVSGYGSLSAGDLSGTELLYVIDLGLSPADRKMTLTVLQTWLATQNWSFSGSIALTGALTLTGLTVTTNGIAVTGNSTISGTLSGISTLSASTFYGTLNGAAPAGSLSGTTLASNVVTSSLTAIGTLASGAVPASLVTAGTFGSGSYTFPGALAITGALTGVTTLTTSGAINGQTISSAASFTGTLAVTGAVTFASSLGVSGLTTLTRSFNSSMLSMASTGTVVTGALYIGDNSLSGLHIIVTSNHGFGIGVNNGADTFYIANTGAATFSSTLAVGTSTLGDSFSVFQFPGTSVGLTLRDSLDTSGAYFQAFRNSAGTIIGSVNRVGTTSAVIYNTTSDYRQKNNIRDLTGSGAFIDALKPRTWEWVSDGSIGSGFVAHEFVTVSPSSVSGTKDAVNVDGEPIYQGMQASTSEVIAHIVAELQSLRLRVAQCEA